MTSGDTVSFARARAAISTACSWCGIIICANSTSPVALAVAPSAVDEEVVPAPDIVLWESSPEPQALSARMRTADAAGMASREVRRTSGFLELLLEWKGRSCPADRGGQPVVS